MDAVQLAVKFDALQNCFQQLDDKSTLKTDVPKDEPESLDEKYAADGYCNNIVEAQNKKKSSPHIPEFREDRKRRRSTKKTQFPFPCHRCRKPGHKGRDVP